MTRNLMACRILEDAEVDLRTVVRSLATAEPESLESAQRLLERLVGTMGEVEAAARHNASLPLKANLRDFRNTLSHAGALNAIALRSIERQATLAGLASGAPGSSLHVEG